MYTVIRFVDGNEHTLTTREALNKMRSMRSVTVKFYDKSESHSIIIDYNVRSDKVIIDGKVLKILKDFNDQQLEMYKDYIKDGFDDYTARIKGTLAFFRFGGWIDGDGTFIELMDTFIISIVKNASLGSAYKIDCVTNILTNVINGRECHLPTTGSELANADFFKIINNL